MRKVLRILNRFNLGGPVYNATYLSRDLAPEFETLLAGGVHEPGERSSVYIPEQEGLHPVIIDSMRRSVSAANDRKAYKEVRSLIRGFRPDIVHTHASKAGMIGRMAALQEKVPVIVHTFHGHVFENYFGRIKTGVFKQLERSLARRSSAVIAISELQHHELSEVHRVVPRSKLHTIRLGFELERFVLDREARRTHFRQQWQLDDDTVAIGIIGRLAPVKNHRMFIDTMVQLRATGQKRVVGIVIGDGALRTSIEEYAKQSGLSISSGETRADIIFTSWITDISTALPGLDLVCLTSLNEGTPVSLIEAQAAGIPVLSTDVGGVRDVIAEGESGFIVPSGDSQALAERISALSDDAEARKRLGEKGISHANAHFGRKRLAVETAALYRSLL
jgi:glycosyltransferase involved in cell wall biosynthesis